MTRSMRFFTALCLLFGVICVATSCGPQPAPGNNQNAAAVNANANVSSPTTKVDDVNCSIDTVRNNIITAIGNTYGSRLPYINVTARADVISLYGYTAAAGDGEHKNIIESANLLIQNGSCKGVTLDTSKFYDGPPPVGDPMRPGPGNACATGYRPCGSICIPANEDCFIKAILGNGNANTKPTTSSTTTASPAR